MARTSRSSNSDTNSTRNSDNGDYYAKSREIPRGSHSSHDSRISRQSRSSSASAPSSAASTSNNNIPRHSQGSHVSHVSRSSRSSSATITQQKPAAKQRVDGGYYNKWNWNQTGAETDNDGLTQDELDILIPALAWKYYHLPGNNCMSDWLQYFANNHPVFGICCHHRLHPIRWPIRILHLLGSFIFGLLVTNMIWLWFLYSPEHDENTVMMTVSVNGDVIVNNNITDAVLPETIETAITQQELQITKGMALLWTVGSASHALFDNCIWYLTACTCCLPGQSLENLARYKKYGIGFVIFTVICIASIATFVVVLRATLQNEEDAAQELQELENAGLVNAGDETFHNIQDKSDFDFLISYSVELCLALFVYYPIIATILFTGIFGCGRIPVLGGRPYEIRLEQVRIRQEQERLEVERAIMEKENHRVRQSRRTGGKRPNNNNNNNDTF